MDRTFHPSVTVAAIVFAEGRYLVVEEDTPEGVRYNQPAGHLEAGESLASAAVREALEETGRAFVPEGLLGVYLARSRSSFSGADVTYLRFAFLGQVGPELPGRQLDHGIRRALWLTHDELAGLAPLHRSPLVMRCVEDHRNGRAAVALDLLHTHPSAVAGLES